MKVAFISGPYESLGVEGMSALLRKHGHDVELFIEPCIGRDDALFLGSSSNGGLFDFSDYIVSGIKNYQPDIIGFSTVSDYYQMNLRIASKIKRQYDRPIVFGGIHPSAVPEVVIKNQSVDYVCVGEGEYALLELVENIQNGKSTLGIKNIWAKDKNSIIKNEIRPLIANLDELPFPDKEIYYKQSSFFRHTYTCMTSRGCFFDCSYCFNSYYKKLYENKGPYFRRRSIDNVMDELVLGLKNRCYSSIRFADDIFNHDQAWLNNFFRRYKKEIALPFDCQLWLKEVDSQTAKILKDAGCYLVEIGVQSYSAKVRERVLGRYYNNFDIERTINILKQSGIRVLCENIYGLPEQKFDDVKASLRFYAKKRVLASFYGLSFFPRTRITDFAKEQGLLNEQDMRNINEGLNNCLFTCGGNSLDLDFKRIHFWLLLTYLLPQRIIFQSFESIMRVRPAGFLMQVEKTIFIFKCRPLRIALRRVVSRIFLYFKFLILKIIFLSGFSKKAKVKVCQKVQ